jgi:D-alanyl-D-alanine carboxypeptidase/D-alanyl-D-alanine-endopeptidase (penicillin-binding protein 4)
MAAWALAACGLAVWAIVSSACGANGLSDGGRPPGAPASSVEEARPAPPPSAAAVSSPTHTLRFRSRPAPWAGELDALIGDLPASVSVAEGGRLRYSHLGAVPRIPASNEKLLLSMALLDRFGARSRIPTAAEARGRTRHGVVSGDLWLVGRGDPEVDDATIERLAREILATGVTRVEGSVAGDRSTFRRERRAPGWHPIALRFVSIPTALTFDSNAGPRGFVFDPEREAAMALTTDLRALGVEVLGAPRAGAAPARLRPVAQVRSAPLVRILRRENVASVNLDAEVLGKRLGAAASGLRGSIARGARAIEAWAASGGVELEAHDASGLSYANRVTTDDMVRLLSISEREPWGAALRSTLPAAGTGTLAGRLSGLDVRAKTGTLIQDVSALSGWVRTAGGRWAAFSILSRGMPKARAVSLEDAVVRFIATRA